MPSHPSAPRAIYAWVTGIALVGLAFIAAKLTAYTGFLSLTPPPSALDPTPVPDVSPQDAQVLYQSAYTAWVALIMTIPAMLSVWLRNHSEVVAQTWRLYWTVGFATFSLHMVWSMAVFFEGDFEWMTTSSRVSAFWPGIIFLFWWAFDVFLAWTRTEDRRWITLQRGAVHVVAFILFVGGSLVMGETLAIKLLGVAFVAGTFVGAYRWWKARQSA